jgi:uncharacterized protein DUF3592
MARPSFAIQNPVTALVFGSAVLLATTLWLSSVIRFALRAEKAVGVVTDSYRCSGGRRSTTCGDVSFTRQDGGTGYIKRAPGTGPKGSRVDVLYDPKDPDDARLSGPFKLWLGPVGLEVLGLLFFGDGLRKFVLRR